MKKHHFWSDIVRQGAKLNPVDRISEILFGLIMVLTFTGSISLTSDGKEEISQLLWAALGCNLAWGIVDAIMYLMNTAAERGNSISFIRKMRKLEIASHGVKALGEKLPPVIRSILSEKELEDLAGRMKNLPQPPAHAVLTLMDFVSAVQIFFLVFLCTFPVALPFAFLEDAALAIKVSNGIALFLLFSCGFMLAKYADFHPFLTAMAYTAIGVILVFLTMILGG